MTPRDAAPALEAAAMIAAQQLDHPAGRAAIQRLEDELRHLAVPDSTRREVTRYVMGWAWQTFDAGSTRRHTAT